MDSQVQVEGRLLDVVDDQWRTETLPLDDIHVGDPIVLFSNINHHQWCFGLLAKQLVAKNIWIWSSRCRQLSCPIRRRTTPTQATLSDNRLIKKIYVASYKVIKTIDQYYPSTPSAITPLKHILLFTSGGKVDRLGSSHNASWADPARILIAKIPHWLETF